MVNHLHSQTYVNREWIQVYGAPDTIEWSESTTDANGEIITVGNTLDSAQHANVLVTKIDWLGMIAWQMQWDGAQSGADYGAAVMTDVNSNIYVAAASQYGNDSTYDIVLLKYNNSGTLLWEESFDGTGGDDYPVKMAWDESGHLYITGASHDTTGDLDYITLKYDTSGNFSWSARYDYHVLTDIAADIVSDSAGTMITVTGGSEDSASIWDYTTVMYNGSGTQLSVDRQSSGEADIKKPKDLVRDGNKNFYITGVDFDSTDYNVKLVKLDSTLNPVWVHVFDQVNEGSHSVAIDDSANLYVGGWQDGDGNSRHFLILKYDSSGNMKWYRTLWPDESKPIAEITKVRIGDNFVINVTGFATNASNSDVITAQYSTGGNFRWMRSWENMAGSIEFPTGVESQGDTVVYVSGRTQDSTGLKWVVMKYSVWLKENEIIYCDSQPCAFDDELLVRFNPEKLNISNIDNRNITWGKLKDFISEDCLDSINAAAEWDVSDYLCYKIHPNFTSLDTTSVTRFGDTVAIPPFYADFGLKLPAESDDSASASALLLSRETSIAQANQLYQPHATVNDPLYVAGKQAGLTDWTGTNPITGANINIEPAWDFETGDSNITVGIFDAGINYKHNDLNYDLSNGAWSKSVVRGGWDYYNGIHPSTAITPDNFGHGTAIAGIIAARRENKDLANQDIGMAGIAGGPSGKRGVSLYDMKIYQAVDANCTTPFVAGSKILTAMTDASLGRNPDPNMPQNQNYKLPVFDILTFSWGKLETQGWTTNDSYIREAFITAYNNDVVLITSSGNAGSACVKFSYPSSFKDHMVMKVGANDASGDRWLPSQCGYNLDFIAPGTTDLYDGLDKSNNSAYVDQLNWGSGCTNGLDGTSLAVPHVAGLAALMLSYYIKNVPPPDNKLTHEDCEKLIERFSTDLKTTGYDNFTGFGRVNAGNVFDSLWYPKFLLQHDTFSITCNTTATVVDTNEKACAEQYNFPKYPWFPGAAQPGEIKVHRWEVTGTNSHTLPAGYDLIDYWPDGSLSDSALGIISAVSIPPCTVGVPYYTDYYFPAEWDPVIVSCSQTNITMKAYFYKWRYLGVDYWYPANPNDPLTKTQFGYTLYLADPLVGIPVKSDFNFTLYPNPADRIINLRAGCNSSHDAKFSIGDIQGKSVCAKMVGIRLQAGDLFSISVDSIAAGMYFLTLFDQGRKFTQKFIVNHE